jgi:PAS domain S-box-containing protein
MHDASRGGFSPPRPRPDEDLPARAREKPRWPHAGGEMAERIRRHDWGTTPLGPIEAWPQHLRTVVDLMLDAKQPAYIAWGAALTSLYNEGYIPILGDKHHHALGRPYAEVFAEIWDEYRPIVAATLAGEPQHFLDQPVSLAGRPGRPMSWFTFSWTPLRDANGAIAGLYCAATETTEKVLAEAALRERQEAALRASEHRYHTLFQSIDAGFCILQLIFDRNGKPADYRYVEINPAFERQTGMKDPLGKTIRELVPGIEPFWFDIYGKVALSGEATRFVDHAKSMGRWFDCSAFRIGEPHERLVAVLFNDITERKQAEERLRESEAQLTQVQEAARIGSFNFDRRTGQATPSPEFLALYGIPKEHSGSFDYENWLALVHPEDRPRIESETQAAVADPTHHQLDYDFRIIRPDTGETRWLAARTRLIRDSDGQFVQSLGAQWDVTAERNAGAALRASEARFRLMADAIPQIVWITDCDGNAEFFNRQWTDYTGASFERMNAAKVADAFVHPEDRAATVAAFEKARQDGEIFEVEHRIRSKTGDYRWFLVRADPYRDPATGEIVRWFGASVDIHDRRLAEAALRESEARFRHMADSAPALIWMTDEEGRVTFANKHYEYMFDRPAADMLGGGWAEIVLPEDLERHTKAFFDAFEARADFHCETRVIDRSGQVRWLRCEGVPRLDDSHRFLGYTGCNIDISDAKVAEEHQRLLINELNHRVKNTMATVQSIASQTLRNTDTAAQAKEAIEGRLIALSRAHDVLTRENWEGADLYEIVDQAVAPYSSRGEDRLHLRGSKVRLQPRTALSLAMMLQELATNAVKYGALSNATGEIRITWEVVRGAPSHLRLRWEESGGPAVQPPTRRGFGTRLIERSLAQDLGGNVDIAFAATGLVCTVDAPLG